MPQHTDTSKNTKAWAVSQHTDTSKNKAWAVFQHTEISKNTKASDIIIIMYIYHALTSALSAYIIHINLNMIFYTQSIVLPKQFT